MHLAKVRALQDRLGTSRATGTQRAFPCEAILNKQTVSRCKTDWQLGINARLLARMAIVLYMRLVLEKSPSVAGYVLVPRKKQLVKQPPNEHAILVDPQGPVGVR